MCAAGTAQELPAQVLHAVFQEVLPGQAGEALRNMPHTHSIRQQTRVYRGEALLIFAVAAVLRHQVHI